MDKLKKSITSMKAMAYKNNDIDLGRGEVKNIPLL